MKSERTEFRCFHPRIEVPDAPQPLIFIDTFYWDTILSRPRAFEPFVECCRRGIVGVVMPDYIGAEPRMRRRLPEVVELLGPAIEHVSTSHITANQIIQSLCCFSEQRMEVSLPWHLMVTHCPALDTSAPGLKGRIVTLSTELNAVRHEETKLGLEGLVPPLVEVERDVWKDILEVYGDLIREHQPASGSLYEEFFLSDFFTNLPAIVLWVYMAAKILSARPLTPNHIIDVVCLAELLPYTSVYIADKELLHHLKQVLKRYRKIFAWRPQRWCVVPSSVADKALQLACARWLTTLDREFKSTA